MNIKIKQILAITTLAAGLFTVSLTAIMTAHAAQDDQVTATTQTALATKAPVKVGKGVDISANELEANLRKDMVIFVGNVIIKQDELTLNADRVTVFYQNEANTKSSINRIDAAGNVHLTTKTETIDATWGIYDFIDRIITLGGKVILKRSDGEITGKKLIYNLDSGLITIEGNPADKNRVKGQFSLPDK